MTPLEKLLIDRIKPNRLREVEWLIQYMKDNSRHGPPLFLSLGETWNSIPQKLLELIATAPVYCHGYHLSSYGYPPLRQRALECLQSEYDLSPDMHKDGFYEAAISATGTRSTMYDYARLLLDNYTAGKKAVLLTMAPGWDYSGVFTPVGYETSFIPLLPNEKFQPNINGIIEKIELMASKHDCAPVFALNTQHNPTGINWPENAVHLILEKLVDRNIPVLIDDAYFSIISEDDIATPSLLILLKILNDKKKSDYPWLFTRSLGKQYGCNGWGIGIIASSPSTLEMLVNQYQAHHHYNINGLYQYALSEWIGTKDAKEHTKRYARKIKDNRKFFLSTLESEMGYPASLAPASTCTNFQLFPIPPKYSKQENGTSQYIFDCMKEAGTLYTDAWPLPYDSDNYTTYDYARVFLGVDQNMLSEAITRMKNAEINYE